MSKGIITFPSILRINVQFLYAGLVALIGFGFWAITSKEWYFFGVLAYLSWAAAVILALKAFGELWGLIKRDTQMRDLGDGARTSRDDKLASTDRLRDGGVIR